MQEKSVDIEHKTYKHNFKVVLMLFEELFLRNGIVRQTKLLILYAYAE
jgi:hypothetical protein